MAFAPFSVTSAGNATIRCPDPYTLSLTKIPFSFFLFFPFPFTRDLKGSWFQELERYIIFFLHPAGLLLWSPHHHAPLHQHGIRFVLQEASGRWLIREGATCLPKMPAGIYSPVQLSCSPSRSTLNRMDTFSTPYTFLYSGYAQHFNRLDNFELVYVIYKF